MDDLDKLADEFDLPRHCACDHPVCIGGECAYECERQDKHEQFIRDFAREHR